MDIELTENARLVLEKRYLVKEEGQVVETPGDMFRRVAENIALAEDRYPGGDREKWAGIFYTLMASLDFLPNSPTLMNAGRDLQQLAACFVLPVADTMEDIFDSIKYAALIHKSGGGTGFSFSRLRPKNDLVASTGGVASGPVSFMKVFNSATEAVKQGGTRRGANMGMLRVDHPDILSFITAKEDNRDLTNFNISVALTEEFMAAVQTDSDYPLINPRDGQTVSVLQARKVFDTLVDAAWRNGEPGIIFLDRVNKDNPTPQLGDIESTNPCGEQPLLPYEACNLGSINISRFVGAGIDYHRLEQVVHQAVRFLDDVIDMSSYPFAKIKEMVLGNRKIGLGIMGFADALYKLSIPYNSYQAVETGREIMEFIQRISREASAQLAQERGAYPNFRGSRQEQLGMPPMRNATTTTIAPTGTISLIAGVSSGIEPSFALCYHRNVLDDQRLIEVHPLFAGVATERGLYTAQLIDEVAKVGSVQDIPNVPEDIRKVFVTAHDVSPEWHIQIQAAFQQYTDNAVSKTVNLAHGASREDVAKVFNLAYELGCKGVTVYRDGSRDSQVLSVGSGSTPGGIVPRPRPQVTAGQTEKVKIGCGNLYISVNSDEQGICEVFTNTGREGGCASQSEATSRLVSIALRSGISVDSIVEQLRGIRCPACIRRPGVNVTSCPDAIAKSLKKNLTGPGISLQQFARDAGAQVKIKKCPECGNTIQHEGGCTICLSCGYSHCG